MFSSTSDCCSLRSAAVSCRFIFIFTRKRRKRSCAKSKKKTPNSPKTTIKNYIFYFSAYFCRFPTWPPRRLSHAQKYFLFKKISAFEKLKFQIWKKKRPLKFFSFSPKTFTISKIFSKKFQFQVPVRPKFTRCFKVSNFFQNSTFLLIKKAFFLFMKKRLNFAKKMLKSKLKSDFLLFYCDCLFVTVLVCSNCEYICSKSDSWQLRVSKN